MRILVVEDEAKVARALREGLEREKYELSLSVALARVLQGNPGFRAVSIFPTLKDGHPVAEVTPAKGDEWKTASEKLD